MNISLETCCLRRISVTDDVALVNIKCKKDDPYAVYKIFLEISHSGINLSTACMAYPPKLGSGVTFAIEENKVPEILNLISKVDNVICTVNGANSRLCLFGSGLDNTKFTVENILDPLYEYNADIKFITTSYSEISIVLSQSKTDELSELLSNLIS